MNGNLFEPSGTPGFAEADRARWDYASTTLRELASYLAQEAVKTADLGARVAFQHASQEALNRADAEFRRSRP